MPSIAVPDVRRDVQHLTRADDDLLVLVFTNPEAQRALEDVRQLFVFVLMPRDDAALLEVYMRQHHLLAGNEPAVEHRRDRLLRHLFPAIPRHFLCLHDPSAEGQG